MRAEVEWTDPAFAKLEALPPHLAFDIVRRVDLLAALPEMGLALRSLYPQLQNCRQLIVERSRRVIYEYRQSRRIVYVLDVQHCRQRLPTAAELKHALGEDAESV